jgi:hypothetical protein
VRSVSRPSSRSTVAVTAVYRLALPRTSLESLGWRMDKAKQSEPLRGGKAN